MFKFYLVTIFLAILLQADEIVINKSIHTSSIHTTHESIRDDKKEVVIDMSTGLMWQDNLATYYKDRSCQQKIDYCKRLDYAGYRDWVLPSITQLESLVDLKQRFPVSSHVFKNLKYDGEYCSSSQSVSEPKSYWIVEFREGYSYYAPSKKHYVKCVRPHK